MSTDASEKTNNVEIIKNRLFSNLKDITEASKGDMNLYSPSKNMRIQIVSKQKVIKSDYTKFEGAIERLQPSVAVFVSFVDNIPFRIKTYTIKDKTILEIHVNYADINERFIDMLANQEDISELEGKTLALENSKKKPKESYIEQYDSGEKEFNDYCKNVPISKIEYEKAKAKWADLMSQFENRTKFIEYIKKLREPPELPPTPKEKARAKKQAEESVDLEEEFYEYIKSTPLSKITKKDIKARFGSLSDSITKMNKTGDDFKGAIKELRESLQE